MGVLGAVAVGAVVAIVVVNGGFLATPAAVGRIAAIGEAGSAELRIVERQVVVDAVDDRFPVPRLHQGSRQAAALEPSLGKGPDLARPLRRPARVGEVVADAGFDLPQGHGEAYRRQRVRYLAIVAGRAIDQFVPALMREGLSRCPAFHRPRRAFHADVAGVAGVGEVDRMANRVGVRPAHCGRFAHGAGPHQLSIGPSGRAERVRC